MLRNNNFRLPAAPGVLYSIISYYSILLLYYPMFYYTIS